MVQGHIDTSGIAKSKNIAVQRRMQAQIIQLVRDMEGLTSLPEKVKEFDSLSQILNDKVSQFDSIVKRIDEFDLIIEKVKKFDYISKRLNDVEKQLKKLESINPLFDKIKKIEFKLTDLDSLNSKIDSLSLQMEEISKN